MVVRVSLAARANSNLKILEVFIDIILMNPCEVVSCPHCPLARLNPSLPEIPSLPPAKEIVSCSLENELMYYGCTYIIDYPLMRPRRPFVLLSSMAISNYITGAANYPLKTDCLLASIVITDIVSALSFLMPYES